MKPKEPPADTATLIAAIAMNEKMTAYERATLLSAADEIDDMRADIDKTCANLGMLVIAMKFRLNKKTLRSMMDQVLFGFDRLRRYPLVDPVKSWGRRFTRRDREMLS